MDTKAGAVASSQLEGTATTLPADSLYDPAWNRIGRIAGYFAGGAFFLAIVLGLAERFGVVGSAPAYRSTDAGALQDEANFYAAYFAHQHQILWEIAVRATLSWLGYVAVMCVGLAILNLVGPRRAAAQLLAASFFVGGLFAAMDLLASLGTAEYWRSTGWSADPAPKMLAIGRDAEAITTATRHMVDAGFVTLAAGLLLLGWLAQEGGRLPSRIGYLAYAGAGLLVLLVVTSELRLATAADVLTIISALAFPSILFWLGHHFGQLART